jgi:uncharacterized membrane protein YhhN
VTVTFLVLAGCAAIVDWAAVWLRLFRIEYAFKPLTIALLITAAALAELGPAQTWILIGLTCGLVGDVALMLSDKDRTDPAFLIGLVAFLVGHVAYIVGFVRQGVHGVDLLAGLLVVLGLFALAMPAILRGADAKAGREFAGVVGLYGLAVGGTAVSAIGTGLVSPAIGGALFALSDTVLGYQRFVRKLPAGDVAVIVTYHVAQYLFVVGLIRSL